MTPETQKRLEEIRNRVNDFDPGDMHIISKRDVDNTQFLLDLMETQNAEVERLRACILDAMGPLDGGPSTCCEGAAAEFSYALDALKRGL